jgi:hypothetical protein
MSLVTEVYRNVTLAVFTLLGMIAIMISFFFFPIKGRKTTQIVLIGAELYLFIKCLNVSSGHSTLLVTKEAESL